MPRKKRVPRLAVVFDTNALFTQIASDLVRPEVRELVRDNSSHVDLNISWHLPDVVVGERKYQMLSKASDLLPNMEKLEKLLGHTFGVGEDTLELHVDNAITRSIEELRLEVIKVDVDNVDWADIIDRATDRRPPFEAGEKEKGFRDTVIGESFLQLHKGLPSTPNVCRLGLVTSDQRLSEYVLERSSGAKNIRILTGLEELESLINTLVSSVSEEFVEEFTDKASKFFFVKGDEKTLFYKENIRDRIEQEFADVLRDPIIPGHMRTTGTWWISNPIFVKKVRQRIHWISMVEPEFEIYHYEEKTTRPEPDTGLVGLTDNASTRAPDANTAFINALRGAFPPPRASNTLLGGLGNKVIDKKGRDKFEIQWSVSVTQSKNLTKPTVDSVKYLGNSLGEDS